MSGDVDQAAVDRAINGHSEFSVRPFPLAVVGNAVEERRIGRVRALVWRQSPGLASEPWPSLRVIGHELFQVRSGRPHRRQKAPENCVLLRIGGIDTRSSGRRVQA